MDFLEIQSFADFVAKKFEGKVDKSGQDYVEHHIESVVDKVWNWFDYNKDRREYIPNVYYLSDLARLHDIFEDTDTSESDILNLYAKETNRDEVELLLTALKTITRSKNENYDDYIKRVGNCRRATIVKLCDLEVNMDIRDLPELTEKDLKRLNKYKKAYNYLKAKLDEFCPLK